MNIDYLTNSSGHFIRLKKNYLCMVYDRSIAETLGLSLDEYKEILSKFNVIYKKKTHNS